MERVTDFELTTSRRFVALAAGCGLLIMTVAYFLADSFVFQELIVPEDAAVTVENISTSGNLFRIGIVGLVVVAVCDLIVAWALFLLLAPINKNVSLLAAWFRLAYSILLVVALFNYVHILRLLHSSESVWSSPTELLCTDVMMSIQAFSDEWMIALLIFGFHLLIVGWLMLRSRFIPKILGFLVIIAGPAYVVDAFGGLLAPGYSLDLVMFFGWGELAFMVWLLYQGIKPPKKIEAEC